MKDKSKTKGQLVTELAEPRQRIAELEAAESGRKRAEQAIPEIRTWLPVAGMFVLLGILVWLNEILDLPHLLLGAPYTPINWREAIIETVMIVGVGLFAVLRLIRGMTERERAEEQVRQKAKDLALVNSLNHAVNRGDSLPDIIALLSRKTKEVFSGNGATVYLVSEDKEYLVMQGQFLPPTAAGQIEKLIGMKIPAVRISLQAGTVYQRVLRSGKPQIINDPAAIRRVIAECTGNKSLQKIVSAIYGILGYSSVIAVPLVSEGGAIGLLDIGRREPFTESDLERIEAVSEHLTALIKHKQADEALQQRTAQLEALREMGLELTAQLDLDTLLRSIVSQAVELLGGISGGLDLYRPERDVLEWTASTGLNVAPLGSVIHRGEGISGKVWETGESLTVDDYQHWEGRAPSWEGIPVAAIVGAPVRWSGEFLGSLIVHADSPRTFSLADAELLNLFATQAAIAIRNTRLYERAQQDITERKRAEEALKESAETQAMLLREVNHRVKNNLTAILGMIYSARSHAGMEGGATYQAAMNTLIGRVQGLAAVNSMLSASEWATLRLSDLAARVIEASLKTLPPGQRVSVEVSPSPVRVTPDEAHNLALALSELATNTIKYGLEERDTAHITFQITHDESRVRCEFRDDGPGYPEDVLRLERYNVGLALVQKIVRGGMRGELALRNDRGAVTIVQFRAETEIKGDGQ